VVRALQDGGPCRRGTGQYKGKIKIAKMDVDKNRQTPGKFGIRNIPTLILFKGGQVVQTIIGAQPKAYIEGELKKLL
jgi:thioredoxin